MLTDEGTSDLPTIDPADLPTLCDTHLLTEATRYWEDWAAQGRMTAHMVLAGNNDLAAVHAMEADRLARSWALLRDEAHVRRTVESTIARLEEQVNRG